MPNVTEAQIKERISSFVQELDLLVRKSALEALHGVLSTPGMPARRGRTAGSRRGTGRPRGAGRGNAGVDEAAAKIVAHVRANDGQGISAIASATGVALPVAKKAAMRLLAEGQIKKSGEKRDGLPRRFGPARPGRQGKTR
jgi:hypothetical protein